MVNAPNQLNGLNYIISGKICQYLTCSGSRLSRESLASLDLPVFVMVGKERQVMTGLFCQTAAITG
jgi:hypothetical protein